MLTYYSRFVRNLSSLLNPLYILLRKDVKWQWGPDKEKAFVASKKQLMSAKFLTHFDSSLQLILACDASAYGLGAVLSHKMRDGSERPIGFASRTLTAAERNYSQREKEGLACTFGVKRFRDYLFGRSFLLITDHKPLLGLLKENKAISPQASARIKRWSLFLSNYEYQLVFRKTEAHANADALSRLPLPTEPGRKPEEPEIVLLAEHLADSPVTAKDIQSWTRRDPKLSKGFYHVQMGWPDEGNPDLDPYSSRRLELSSYKGCVLWGNRVVIPPPGRQAVLQELHEGHPGMSRMKALSRMYVWWPGINADIEKSVRLSSMSGGMFVSSYSTTTPLEMAIQAVGYRLHVDFAGPFQGKYILVAIDAHSKWIEAVCTSTTSSIAVIEELRTICAKFGLPESIVIDNGPCFVSAEFKSFLESNGIKHTTSAPYHPASNGLVERAVQTVKRGLKRVTSGSRNTRLAKVLFSYRITPQGTTGISPAELLLNRSPRTRLDLLHPNTSERVEQKQQQQKKKHDRKAKSRAFHEGDTVLVRNFGSGCRWLPGRIVQQTGPVLFRANLEDGRLRKCHQDQLRTTSTRSQTQTSSRTAESNTAESNEQTSLSKSQSKTPRTLRTRNLTVNCEN